MEPGGRRLPTLFPTGDSRFPAPQATVFGQASEAGPPVGFGHPVGGAASSALPAAYGPAPGPSHVFSFKPLNPFPAPASFGRSTGGNFGHPEPTFSSLGHPDLQRARAAGLDAAKAPNKLPSFHFSQAPSSGGEAGVFGLPQSKAGPSAPVFSFSQAASSSPSSFFGLPRPKATTSLPDAFSFSQPTAVGSSAESFRFVQPAPFTFSQPSVAGSVDALASNKTLGSEEKTGQKPVFGVSDASPLLAYDGKRGATGVGGIPARIGPVPKYEVEEEQLATKKGVKRKDKRDKSPQQYEHSPAKEQAVGTISRLSLGKRPVKVAPSMGVFNRTLRDVLKGRRETKRDSAPSEDETIERLKLLSETSIPLKWPGRMRKEETKKKSRDDFSGKTASRRLRRGDSTDSQSSTPLSELTAIQCKNIPADLNKKEIIREHFSQYGKVQRVYCQTSKNLAVVHFANHVSASTAKRNGKTLCKQRIEIFWQRKKNSPGKKSSWEEKEKPKGDEEKPCMDKPNTELSPLHNPTAKAAAVGSMANRSPVKNASSKSQKPESEPQHSPEMEDPVMISERIGTLPSSLSHLIGTVAVNPEEKYRVLDQRDKLMRQARVKRTDLEKAKAVVGTCMDMCPEKERYMRETRYQLSPFEIIPGTDKVNHEAAVKEYSRSSADQEEPLPHELRPASVLKLTMDYLVTQIMDLGEGNYREWYDFLWNRTRGVRKDITQQHLCDKMTVALIEKCTRFHIHCSHHLCEEPMSSYDAKINDENLTKCLQSLKEMYQDLATKETYCENEAEFRSYHVLLNLNEGDILREVQQFRPVIRNSPEVKLAVQAFAALNSNNYVRFFKLVKAASYLSACILHRYFKQVRREALKTLNFALTVSSQRSTMFPMDTLVRMLLFKDCGEAAEFARDYGLSVSDWCVELNRSALCDPDFVLLPKKSLFIDRKRTTLIGEVVNGGPLPLFIPHVPVLSFDSQGRYIGECFEPSNVGQKLNLQDDHEAEPKVQPQPETSSMTVLLKEQTPAQEIFPVEQPSQPSIPPLLQILTSPPAASLSVAPRAPSAPPPKPQLAYPEKMILDVVKDLVKEMVKDVLHAECKEVAKAGATYAAEAISMSDVSTEELIAEVTTEMLKETSSEEIQAERQRIEDEKHRIEQARLKQEWELWKSRYSRALCDELTDQVVEYAVRKCATQELSFAVEEDRRARIDRCSTELCNYLIKETLESEIFQAVKETLQEVHCFCKYLKKWRATAEARKRLRKQMWMFPAAPGSVGLGCKLSPQKRSPEIPPEDNLSISCTRLLQRRKEIAHQIRVQNFYQQLLCQAAWTPLDLFTLVAESFPIRQKRIFWKVVLLLPSDEECGLGDTNRILIDWLKAKFRGNECVEDLGSDADNVIQTHQCKAVSSNEAINELVYICVKVTKGPLSDTDVDEVEQRKELLGTTALILLLPARVEGSDQDEEEVYWLSAMLQVRQLLQAKPLNPAVPLVILVPREGKPLSEEEVIDGLKLEALVATHLVSEFFIVLIPEKINDLQGSNKVSAAVSWLASRCPSPPEVCCQTLMQFIEDGLCREFSDQFYNDKSERQSATLPSQDPSSIIELYNDVLQFLSEVVSSEQLYNLSWPVAEFSGPTANEILAHKEWNSSSHLAWLKNAVLSFQLPVMDLPPLNAPWPKVCDMIFHYVSQVPWSQQACPLLLSKVEQLLNRIRDRWRESCFLMLEASADEGPSVSEIPWDEIIAYCIDHRLREWKPLIPPCSAAVSEDGQILVYYFQDDLKKYKLPIMWQRARSQTQMEIQEASKRLSQKQACSSIKRKLDFKPYAEKVSSEETLPERSVSALDITRTYSAEELLPERLRSGLEIEREENRRCEEQLYRWLDEGPLEPVALPLYLPQSLASAAELVVPRLQASALSSPQDVANKGHSEESNTNDSNWLNDSTMTLSDKLKEFTRLIQASREEEITCERHLSILLDLTDT
ncbi:germinal-center associated nuclear protein isoform X3 [Pristis pectinata]|uniref:germinal-center associated nuclear protein isoform X3 n=1 Tax=Pristis pectinata TaxID=685728 RepID=UPI00223E2FC8|nr:germinal-center associated nuclear protein isoform X3 [Pristis pectinata]